MNMNRQYITFDSTIEYINLNKLHLQNSCRSNHEQVKPLRPFRTFPISFHCAHLKVNLIYTLWGKKEKNQDDCEGYGLEPRRCGDIKGIVTPEIRPKNFTAFEKQACHGDSVYFS